MRPEDWQGLAPERDRPEHPEFDWQPEALHLSAAAALVVRMHEQIDYEPPITQELYGTTMYLWKVLCGMDEAAALTYAYQIADAVPPVTGTAIPF